LNSDAQPREKREIITAILGVIFAGASVGIAAGVAASNAKIRVSLHMEITNQLTLPLTTPLTHIHRGVVDVPARQIEAGTKEAMVMRKTRGAATGSYGTVSWTINNKEIIVMWLAPYGFNANSNWLAVGIAPAGTHTRQTYEEMYCRDWRSWKPDYFVRHNYEDVIRVITKCDDVICVRGTMGNSHHPEVHITVYRATDIDRAAVGDTYHSSYYESYVPRDIRCGINHGPSSMTRAIMSGPAFG